MAEINYLFVYGTLLSGYDDKTSQAHLEKYATLVGKATVQGKMYMVDYYPGLIPAENDKSLVYGELYKILDAKALFGFLDKYEEYFENDIENSEYIRAVTQATLVLNKEQFDAYVYFYNQSVKELELLPKGDFLNEYHK